MLSRSNFPDHVTLSHITNFLVSNMFVLFSKPNWACTVEWLYVHCRYSRYLFTFWGVKVIQFLHYWSQNKDHSSLNAFKMFDKLTILFSACSVIPDHFWKEWPGVEWTLGALTMTGRSSASQWTWQKMILMRWWLCPQTAPRLCYLRLLTSSLSLSMTQNK